MTGSEREVTSGATASRTIRNPSATKSLMEASISIMLIIGGAEGDRTPDLMTASHALSQLSYGPMSCGRWLVNN
jgi:hypothetical protein